VRSVGPFAPKTCVKDNHRHGVLANMALKYKLNSKDEIPAEFASLYVKRDGAFFLDADGVVEKSKLDEFRSNNVALQKQLSDLSQRFEGIDPDAVKRLFAEKAKLIKDGEVQKLV